MTKIAALTLAVVGAAGLTLGVLMAAGIAAALIVGSLIVFAAGLDLGRKP